MQESVNPLEPVLMEVESPAAVVHQPPIVPEVPAIVAEEPVLVAPVVAPVVPEPEAPHQRAILEMLGLPQSFLRDNGFEEELFDNLPESIQMEVLLPMIGSGQSQQRPPAPRQEDHKEEHPEIDQEFLEGLPE